MPRIKKQILPEEVELVEQHANNLTNIKHYKIKVKKDLISFWCADESVASICGIMKNYMPLAMLENFKNNVKILKYREILQFKLISTNQRIFMFRLKFGVKDENNFWCSEWADVGEYNKLSFLVEKYLPLIKDGVIDGFSPNWALPPTNIKI